MKIVILCLLVLTVGCNNKQPPTIDDTKSMIRLGDGVYYKEHEVEGMKYGVYSAAGIHAAQVVVNVTKDKLEVELLQKQLKEDSK